jgi:hypothetical protein
MAMRIRNPLLALLAGLTAATVARSGHEVPIYPSYYPHEIQIETIASEHAPRLLSEGKLHAFIGDSTQIGAAPGSLGSVESLGSFLIMRVNPSRDEGSACGLIGKAMRTLAASAGNFIVHPYPVTPFHGDYLQHIDLSEAAKVKWLGAQSDMAGAGGLRLKIAADANALKALFPPEWYAPGDDWDLEVSEISAAELVESTVIALNGWTGPPWARSGWFHAHRLLGGSVRGESLRQEVERARERLESAGYRDSVERINLERQIVTTLARGCHAIVAGYRVKRNYFNAEFSAGVENIGFDAITGFASPIFLRTVKLKDFPWNGWLSLGTDKKPVAAWNPIAGFTDGFGRLMWSAVGDPALLPAPYASEWMLNRVSDVQTSKAR